jgi:two-component system, OmpR family, sensor kinase
LTARESMQERLGRRITIVGTIGGTILLVFVGLDFDILFGEGMRTLGLSGVLHEIIDHVILPLLVLTYPAYLITRLIARAALEPLRTAAERIESAGSHERGFRVDGAGLPIEAMPFIDAVNGLLHRLDDAAERQEAFATDVAHELRTPLAIARLEIDRLDDPALLPLSHEMDAMARLIDQLLLMAKLDAHAASPTAPPNSRLEEVATTVASRMAVIAVARNRTLKLDVLEKSLVVGHAEIIGSALRNLIENALRVTPEGGTVGITVGPGPQLRVSDGGPGLAPDQLVSLCERFRRLENDRHNGGDGAGLGLAIVSRIMKMYDGSIATDQDHRELQLRFVRAASSQ